MQKITVTPNEAGQRLDKLLAKHLSCAPKSFFYKMLRKKNIKLNGKKAEGSEKLNIGDEITLFLSDETIEKFSSAGQKQDNPGLKKAMNTRIQLDIVYEDEHVLFLNKPAGMLSQKAAFQDISLNEYMTAYLVKSGALKEEELAHFRPSVCNRLDRNTSGLVACGKTLPGLQGLSEMFRERTMKKYYLTLVKGKITKPQYIKGYLWKDEKKNKVTVWEERPETGSKEDIQPIETGYRPLASNGELTLLEVHLITGRTHQIRAHLASQGHPVAGDNKYGDRRLNERLSKNYKLSAQFLHAWRMEFPVCEGALAGLSELTLKAQIPALLNRICKGENIKWEHGIPEV